TWTALGQAVVTVSSSDTLTAIAYGSTIAVNWNGVFQLSVQDTNDTAGTSAGIYFGTYSYNGNRPTLSGFSVTPTGSAPPTPGAPVAPPTCNSGATTGT